MIQIIGDVEAPSQKAQHIAVHDHIVVGKNGHTSMKELKLNLRLCPLVHFANTAERLFRMVMIGD